MLGDRQELASIRHPGESIGGGLPLQLRFQPALLRHVPGDADEVRFGAQMNRASGHQTIDQRAIAPMQDGRQVLAFPRAAQQVHHSLPIASFVPQIDRKGGAAHRLGPSEAGHAREAIVDIHHHTVVQTADDGAVRAGREHPLHVLCIRGDFCLQPFVEQELQTEHPQDGAAQCAHVGSGLGRARLQNRFGRFPNQGRAQRQAEVQQRCCGKHHRQVTGRTRHVRSAMSPDQRGHQPQNHTQRRIQTHRSHRQAVHAEGEQGRPGDKRTRSESKGCHPYAMSEKGAQSDVHEHEANQQHRLPQRNHQPTQPGIPAQVPEDHSDGHKGLSTRPPAGAVVIAIGAMLHDQRHRE